MQFIIRRFLHSSKSCSFYLNLNNCSSNLLKLRKSTGYPLASCKKALQQFNDDIEQATKYLNEQAQKEGWAKVDKLKDRKTTQGLLGFQKLDRLSAIVELNCETDFVAKNEKFSALLGNLTQSILKNLKTTQLKEVFFKDDLLKVKSINDPNRTIGDELALGVANLGENMTLRRAIVFNIPKELNYGWYVHGIGQETVGECKFGKYVGLVSFKVNKYNQEIGASEIGRQLAQHVVGMKPTSLGEINSSEPVKATPPPPPPPPTPTPEPTATTTTTTTPSSENIDNPEDSEYKPKESKFDESETRLLYQEFLMKPDIRVLDFTKEHDVEIVDFIRIECGEVIENEPK